MTRFSFIPEEDFKLFFKNLDYNLFYTGDAIITSQHTLTPPAAKTFKQLQEEPHKESKRHS